MTTKIQLMVGAVLISMAAGATLSTTPAIQNDSWARAWWRSKAEAISAAGDARNYEVVFLGDSITDFWAQSGKKVWEENFAEGEYAALNAGIGGDRTENVLWRLENRPFGNSRPKAIVLMIGTNNTGHRPFAQEPAMDTIAGIRAIVLKLHADYPEAKVILHPIFPRGAMVSDPLRRRNDVVNRELKAIAKDIDVIFCDFNSKLTDAEGKLSREMCPDLTHPSEQGYRIWAREVKPYLAYALGKTNALPEANAPMPTALVPLDKAQLRDAVCHPGWFKDGRYQLKRDAIQANKSQHYDLVMVGDSITHFWETEGREVLAGALGDYSVLDIGFSGGRVEQLIWDCQEGGLLEGYTAPVFTVMIGTNNGAGTPADVASGVRRLVEIIREKHPRAKVLLHAILPRGEKIEDAARQRNDEVNALIRHIADGEKVLWVDLGEKMTNKDGSISKEMFGDFLHPTKLGYERWAEELLPYLRRYVKHGVGVWWHWMGYEITRAGIQRDLAAMEECEVADATIFSVSTHSGFWCAKGIENVPDEKISYWNDEWWKMVRFAVEEGRRRGISIGMQCSPGYTHTGGRWITPENAMKKLTWSEDGSEPKHDARFYRDIATVEANGKRYRFGYTLTGATSGPAPDDIDGKCLEADKLSARAMREHAKALMGGIREQLGELVGDGFDFIVMDSYEAGDADWTDDFAAEFQRRRGYDPIKFLPVFAGEQMEGAEKFRQDFAAVRAELFMERCLGTMREAAHAEKLKIRIEPYDFPCDSVEAAKYADVPMIEFWVEGKIQPRFLKAGEKTEYPIVGAEAFTSDAWTADFSQTPKDYKQMADRAFAMGVNHLCLHDWVHQPFSAKWRPGLSMGFFGTHFGENQTWFEPGKAFFRYLKNCQRELRRGESLRTGLEIVSGVVGCERQRGDETVYFMANTNSFPVGVAVSGGEYQVYDPESERTECKEAGTSIRLSGLQAVFVRGKGLEFSKTSSRRHRKTRYTIGVKGPWEISFEPSMGAPEKSIVLKDLRSLSSIDLKGVRYFSGTATYTREFWMEKPDDAYQVRLELGDVREMVALKVNGRDLGVCWHEPFEYDITQVVSETPLQWGKVRLDFEIKVTNTWRNRLIGDNFEIDDCEWHPVNPRMSGPAEDKLSGRGIKRIPDFVMRDGERKSKARIGWCDWDYFSLDTPLLPSGLLGPVRIVVD